MSPFGVRRETFHEVLLIYVRLVLQNARKNPDNKKEEPVEGSFVIGDTLYKPALNDDWY